MEVFIGQSLINGPFSIAIFVSPEGTSWVSICFHGDDLGTKIYNPRPRSSPTPAEHKVTPVRMDYLGKLR